MISIAHRRNTLEQLAATPINQGVEVDLRSQGSRLIIHHDPFVADALDFEEWLAAYRHRMLILNVKEEGLEDRLLELMKARGIEEFFFLDQSFPFLIRTAKRGERRCAVRVSEFETVETALSLAGQVDWIWVDCFTRFPLDRVQANRLKAAGMKLCLVSPELQGRTDPSEIAAMRALLTEQGIAAEAVCTKTPELWH
ncbi:phosphatidylinositol-specific phospholipase C/glycerophosphodiester phosphodiesterase family protein [Pseudoroseomonas globiformis]|uniref:Phosphatidylinositol-specific phospholipase C/glycerophosphodiester phosphodiesterase family protein n=1 Tax=Teichococcus globiformis TaxID=2307229 RepID=A0ABV7FZX0_9PROT